MAAKLLYATVSYGPAGRPVNGATADGTGEDDGVRTCLDCAEMATLQVTFDAPLIVGLVGLLTVAAFVNGTIGFGFALLAVNALAAVLDAKTGVIVMSVITPITTGLQSWHHRDRRDVLPRLRAMIAASLVGSLVGTQLLVRLPGHAITLALGVFTIWFAVRSMRAERPPMAGSTERWLGPIAGVVGGISNGALGASGPVFGSYLTAIGLRGADFAFAISIAFFAMAILRIGLLAALDQYTLTIVGTGLALAVPAVLGQRVGFWFRGRLRTRALYRGVLVVLLVAGVNLLVRAALAMAG